MCICIRFSSIVDVITNGNNDNDNDDDDGDNDAVSLYSPHFSIFLKVVRNIIIIVIINKMLSYRRETALQGAL